MTAPDDRKPGGRADDDDWLDEPTPVLGRAEATDDTVDDTTRYAAVLWVPDPEARRGWREYYVRKARPERRVGFGRD